MPIFGLIHGPLWWCMQLSAKIDSSRRISRKLVGHIISSFLLLAPPEFPLTAFSGSTTVFILTSCFEATQFSSVAQSCPTLCNPWTAAHQASLSITNSWSLLKLMSIELVMPSNHLILCHPLFLLPSIFPSIRVFSKQSVLHIRWPKY